MLSRWRDRVPAPVPVSGPRIILPNVSDERSSLDSRQRADTQGRSATVCSFRDGVAMPKILMRRTLRPPKRVFAILILASSLLRATKQVGIQDVTVNRFALSFRRRSWWTGLGNGHEALFRRGSWWKGLGTRLVRAFRRGTWSCRLSIGLATA